MYRKGDAYKQAGLIYWSPFCYSWPRIKSKTIFGIGLSGSAGEVGCPATLTVCTGEPKIGFFFNIFSHFLTVSGRLGCFLAKPLYPEDPYKGPNSIRVAILATQIMGGTKARHN